MPSLSTTAVPLGRRLHCALDSRRRPPILGRSMAQESKEARRARPPRSRKRPKAGRKAAAKPAAKAAKRGAAAKASQGQRQGHAGRDRRRPTCRAEKCKQPVRAKGYCRKHFIAWRRGEVGDHHRYKICSKEACRKPRTQGGLCDEHAGSRAPAEGRARRGRSGRLRALALAEDRHPRRRPPRGRGPRLGRQERRAADPRLVAARARALDLPQRPGAGRRAHDGSPARRAGRRLHRRRAGGTAHVDTSAITELEAPYELVKTMRASVLVLGPLVRALRPARACRCPAAAPSARGRSISTSRASRRWARASRSSTATSTRAPSGCAARRSCSTCRR